MKTGRGNEIGYPETQLMIPRPKKGTSSVIIQGDGPAGIVHAMWGYTYEIPNFTDTFNSDPGVSESDAGTFYQYIVPITTIVDRVTWAVSPGLPVIAHGPISFALYDMNIGNDGFPIIVKSETLQAFGLVEGRHTQALEEQVSIPPGLYGLGYIGPCFQSICIQGNALLFGLVNQLKQVEDEGINRFGTFTTTGPYDPGGTVSLFPDTLDSSNVLSLVNDYSNIVPLTYWDNSQEFG